MSGYRLINLNKITKRFQNIVSEVSDCFSNNQNNNMSSAGRSSSSSSSGSMLCASHGSVSVCGRRREMNDTVTIEPGFLQSSQTAEIEYENFDFFAVYDGHGGSCVAQLCKDRLHQLLADEIHEMMSAGAGSAVVAAAAADGDGGEEETVVVEGIWERIMKTCFVKIDAEIAHSGVEEGVGSTTLKRIGSTAVVAVVVSKEKLIIANCGDSKAVLCRGGVVVPLSSDHYLKPYLISEPEVILMERTTNDEFIILASDGLWDVMSNEIACDIVRKYLDGQRVRRISTSVEGNDVVEVAALLVELAIARGSKDNISVIIVELSQSK